MTGLDFSPSAAAAIPNNTAANKVGNNSPFARAPTKLSGIILPMNAPIPCSVSEAAVVYLDTSASPAADVSIPSPAFTKRATPIPIANAIVDTISKYNNALPPILPTFSYLPYRQYRLRLLRR